MTRVADWLARARALGLSRLDAQLLLVHHLQRPRAWLIAHDDAAVPEHLLAPLTSDLARRADGVPLAQLTGWREFHGLRLRVTSDVLDPRPATETLVEWALERLRACGAESAPPRVIDLGTGSGAIALAVKQAWPSAQVAACDVSSAALAVARDNAARLRLEVDSFESNWWSAVSGPPCDLALSNPPYIAGDDPHLHALRHEPRLALTPEGDGLDALRAVIKGACPHLKPGAWLLLEHGHDQAAAVCTLLRAAGFKDVESRRDLGGNWRCSGGRWAA